MKPVTHPAQFIQWTLALILAVSLAGCETGGGLLKPTSPEARAERLAERGAHAEAAAAYIGLASEREGMQRDRLTLLAVHHWINADDLVRARNALDTVAAAAGSPMYTANVAALALRDDDTERAVELLEALSRESMSTADRLRVELRRAEAWFAVDEPARAVELMTQRETWLNSSEAIESNRRTLWQDLLATSPVVLRESALQSPDPEIRGWLTLGSLATTTSRQGIGWSNGLVRWRERHPDHPALLVIEDLPPDTMELLDYPRRIALLLPLSGRAANAGAAIQNGFLGAYFATAGGLDDRQSIRVYDVEREGGALAAYAAAVSEGAEFIVGPLLRSNVVELANDTLVPVPVLTLNYLPEESLAPPGLFQFGLAPEDEAVAAAERAILDGHERAVVLVPNSNWGSRVLRAFIQHYEFLGGTALDYRLYTESDPDFSGTLENLMALSGSVRRYNRLRANIGGPLQFDPRRRQDVDAIFLGADAPAGRLLKAQLKFHYSGDLPVYSTSLINAMDGRSNTDLNGIFFADVPWVIDPQGWNEYLPKLYKELWPEQRRLARLHAMGYDAYQLVAPLFANRTGTMPEMAGATGRLRLDRNGRVYRGLAWAKFEGGEIVALPDPEPAAVAGLDTEASSAPVAMEAEGSVREL